MGKYKNKQMISKLTNIINNNPKLDVVWEVANPIFSNQDYSLLTNISNVKIDFVYKYEDFVYSSERMIEILIDEYKIPKNEAEQKLLNFEKTKIILVVLY